MEPLQDTTAMGLSCLLYALAFILATFSVSKEKPRLQVLFNATLLLGFILHTLGLYARGRGVHSFPLTTPFEVVQSLCWSAIALNLVVRHIFNLRLLQYFSSALVACLSSVSFLLFDSTLYPVSTASNNPWVGFHAGLAIGSYSIFGILAITSLMYLIQHYGLQSMRSGGVFSKLPAIRQLEDINSKLIFFGVSTLSVAIFIGFLNWFYEPADVGFFKLLVASAIWGSYGILLYLRKTKRVVASRFACACIVLFMATLFSLWPLTRKQTNAGPSTEHSLQSHASY